MKKIRIVLWEVLFLAMVFCFCIHIGVADEGKKFETANEMLLEWSRNDDYPEYYCGAWAEGDRFILAFTNDDNGHCAAEKTVQLIEDMNSVSIVYQQYSYAYLKSIMSELCIEIGEYGILCIGIDDYENCVHIILSPYATEEKREELRCRIYKKYDTAAKVSDGRISLVADEFFNEAFKENNESITLINKNIMIWSPMKIELIKSKKFVTDLRHWSWITAYLEVAFLIIACALFFTRQKKVVPAMIQNSKYEVHSFSKSFIEELIRKSALQTNKEFDIYMMEEFERLLHK